MRVLIVEDDAATGRALKLALAGLEDALAEEAEPERVDVQLVGCATDAIEALHDGSPDVAIVDLHLVREGGDELTRALAIASPRTRVLLFSGVHENALAEEAAKCGAHAWMTKPLSSTDLVGRVLELTVRRSSLPPSLRR